MIDILLIQPENEEINKFRKKQFNNFSQVTIPYLAAYIDESMYKITILDEYNEKIPFDKKYDLVALTVNTPNAKHCYEISNIFRNRGTKVVMGGPHVTLLPDEAGQHCDYLMIGEAEQTWPVFLDDCFRTRPIGQVIEEIRRIKSRYFVFWDDNFFADKQYAIALMTELKQLNRRWAAQVTISACEDDQLLNAAKESR